MNAKPLSKAIYDKAKSLGITKIELNFSGGNDEGYLSIETSPEYNSDFKSEIKNWVWSVYDYSGAGDGTSYGDNVIYDLETGKVTTDEWYHVVQNEVGEVTEIEVE